MLCAYGPTYYQYNPNNILTSKPAFPVMVRWCPPAFSVLLRLGKVLLLGLQVFLGNIAGRGQHFSIPLGEEGGTR